MADRTDLRKISKLKIQSEDIVTGEPLEEEALIYPEDSEGNPFFVTVDTNQDNLSGSKTWVGDDVALAIKRTTPGPRDNKYSKLKLDGNGLRVDWFNDIGTEEGNYIFLNFTDGLKITKDSVQENNVSLNCNNGLNIFSDDGGLDLNVVNGLRISDPVGSRLVNLSPESLYLKSNAGDSSVSLSPEKLELDVTNSFKLTLCHDYIEEAYTQKKLYFPQGTGTLIIKSDISLASFNPPYRLDQSGLIQNGYNSFTIDVLPLNGYTINANIPISIYDSENSKVGELHHGENKIKFSFNPGGYGEIFQINDIYYSEGYNLFSQQLYLVTEKNHTDYSAPDLVYQIRILNF